MDNKTRAATVPEVSYRPYRLEVRGQITFLQPFHIGTGERLNLLTDSPVLREANQPDGQPYLPGTSLRGVLRDYLEREAPLLGCAAADVASLFGPSARNATLQAGRLRIDDACVRAGAGLVETRDHVRINRKWGAADQGAKFDAEATLQGATYDFRATYEGDGSGDLELLLLEAALRHLESGQFQVGAKASWGYGRLQLKNVSYAHYDRATDGGLAAFLASRLGKPAVASLVPHQWPLARKSRGATSNEPAAFSELRVKLCIQFDGPVLVKAAFPPQPPANRLGNLNAPERYSQTGSLIADHVFLSTALGSFPLPGSSLRGVLHSQAERISRTLVGDGSWAEALFGSARGQTGKGRRGRLEVEDGKLTSPVHFIYLDHVAIDRITNAAADEGQKFATCSLASPTFQVEMRVCFTDQEYGVAALFGLLLRDLMRGRLWAGSGVSRGYGRVSGATFSSACLSLVATSSLKLAGLPAPNVTCGRQLYSWPAAKAFQDLKPLWIALQPYHPKPTADAQEQPA